MRARMRTWAAAAAAVAVGFLGLAGCGVPLDESPQPVTRPTVAVGRGTPTTIASADGAEVGVYFLRDDRLVRQSYPVEEDADTVTDALGFVLDGPPEGTDDLRSAIPPGTALATPSEVPSNGILAIDVSDDINDVQGLAQKEAFAQLAFTALDAVPSLRGVRFLVDGEPVAAPTDEGNLEVVTADDYAPPLNPR